MVVHPFVFPHVHTDRRPGSNVDLGGFHTPHGGSVTDLTTLSPPAKDLDERAIGIARHAELLAALGSSTDSSLLTAGVPSDGVEGTGEAVDEERRGQGYSAMEDHAHDPGDWSVGSQARGNHHHSPENQLTRTSTAAAGATGVAIGPNGAVDGNVQQKQQQQQASPAGPSRPSGDVDTEHEGEAVLSASELLARRRHADQAGVPSLSAAEAGSCESTTLSVEHGSVSTARCAATMVAAPAGISSGSAPSPVMSLSGHLISPEMRRGQVGDEVKRWAHDAFMRQAITWDDFSCYPQVQLVKSVLKAVNIMGSLRRKPRVSLEGEQCRCWSEDVEA